MNKIVNTQTLLFLKAIEIGILLAMFYDVVRIFRKLIKHSNWLVQIEDGLYWLFCIMIAFSVLYSYNFADLRIFVFIGMLLGSILYLCTLSILFMKIATWCIDLIEKVLRYIIGIVLIPVNWIIYLVKIPLRFMRKQCISANTYGKKKLRKMKRKIYYIKADISTAIKINKNKNIYKTGKKD